jgi:hypothetical protein
LPWKEEVWKGLVERREEEGVGDERRRRENLYQKLERERIRIL